MLDEYLSGTVPVYGNTHQDGGIAWADSEMVTINLQPFERPEYGLVDGALEQIFSPWPNSLSGWDVGDYSAPILGDWDADGDLDLFILHEGGMLAYENTGSPYAMNLEDRSAYFSALSATIGSIFRPMGALADVNGDGNADLVVGGNTGTLSFYYSSGTFGTGQPVSADYTLDSGSSSAIPALGEYDGDGLNDLLVLLDDGSVDFYSHTGLTANPYLSGSQTLNFLGVNIINGTSMAAEDINDDGLIDLLVSDTDGRIWEFEAASLGSLALSSKVWGGSAAGFASGLTLTAGDLDGDGDLDAIGGLANGGVVAFRDPKVGRPTALIATSGADSILLTWDPDRQSRIKGYYIYRGSVDLPLSLDDAAGLASIDVQINYNPELLGLENVTSGPLGQQFDLIYTSDEGVLNLSFVSGDGLVAGSGQLVVLRFRAKEGSPVGMVSQVALASCFLGDSSGVVALQRKDAVHLFNGQLEVTDSENIDNHGNGLPDWWEIEYGLDQFADHSGLDPDGDHLTNIQEFYAGTDPLDGESLLRLFDVPEFSGSTHTLRWQSASNRFYCIESTTNLLQMFEPIAEHIPATPGTNVFIISDPPTANCLFYRIKLEE